jgi:DNA-directed RNA polymerase specialized sigma24 family protein
MISAQSQAREGRAAFAELYQLYRYPLYAFARRGGHSPEDAQDLTQGFFFAVPDKVSKSPDRQS